MSGNFSVIRVDDAADLTSLTTLAGDFPTGSLAFLADDGAGAAALRYWNGSAWVARNIGGISVGSVTLAGDATGPSSSNTVVALTGTTNIVAMHGNAITWDVGATPSLSQTARATDAAVHDWAWTLQSPFASATGTNRNSPNLTVTIPAPATGGAPGFVKVSAGISGFAATPRVAIGPVVTAVGTAGAIWLGEVPATTPSTNTIDGSTTGNFAIYGNGTDSLRLNVPGIGNSFAIQWWGSGILTHSWTHGVFGFGETNPLANNVAFQQSGKTTNNPVCDMYFIPQAPFSGATGTNRNAPNLFFITQSPIAGGVEGGVYFQYGSNEHYFQKTKWTIFQAAGSPTITAGTAAPSAAEVDGSQYIRTGSPNGDFYVRKNGVWVSITSGTSVTLAGDVTGPSGGNVVEALTGSGGSVTMKAQQLAWQASLSTFIIGQSPQTTNHAPPDFALVLSTPFASATGTNRDAPDGGFWIPPPVASGATGRWIFYVSDTERFAIEYNRLLLSLGEIRSTGDLVVVPLDATGTGHAIRAEGGAGTVTGGDLQLYGGAGPTVGNVVLAASAGSAAVTIKPTMISSAIANFQFIQSVTPVINQETIAGTPHAFIIQSQASTTTKGGQLAFVTGTGSGGSHGDMTFSTGARPAFTLFDASFPIFHLYSDKFRIDKSIPSPVIFQEGRDSDIACTSLTIRSQAPFSGAATNKIPGNLIYEVPAPAAGGDPPGWHSFKVSAVEYVNITTAQVRLNTGIQFTNAFMTGGTSTIYSERAGASSDGAATNIEGQQGGTGNTDGGPVTMTGGARTGSGKSGPVILALNGIPATSVAVMARDATHGAVVLNQGGTFTTADLPGNMTGYVMMCDEAGTPTSDPVGGHVYASVSGNPYWLTANGNQMMYIGSTHGTNPAVPPGAFVAWIGWQFGNINGAIPFYAV